MFQTVRINYVDKQAFYAELESEIRGLLETTWFTNLSNVSAALMQHLPDLNWVGFYLQAKPEVLQLGPFQGLPACLSIPFTKGVCGKAAREKKSVLVDDVHAFPGHIACDARSRSELVIPLILKSEHGDRVLGVLDLDSPLTARFDEEDRRGLERIATCLVDSTQWPTEF
jgi:GAF domain-containing protein